MSDSIFFVYQMEVYMMEERLTTVDRIRALANQKGMSLPTLESELGLGNGTISRWAKSSPNTEKISRVADYFHVSVDYLIGRETNDDDNLQLDRGYTILSREAKKMTPEQRQKLISIAKIMFDKEFDDT